MNVLRQQHRVSEGLARRGGPPLRRGVLPRARVCLSPCAAAHPGAGSNFALETMSEDGQGWVWDELGQKLVGLKHRTPRASCKTTSLLSYRGDLSSGEKALRVERLNLDLSWEATARGAEGRTFTGLAKVKFGGSEDGQDVVDVEVAVDPQCLNTLPGEREKLVKDVVYAVESLDTAIMEQLNDFLWSMEQHNVLNGSSGVSFSSNAEAQAASAAAAVAAASEISSGSGGDLSSGLKPSGRH
ncbi:hypothetical protein HYH02_001709 [Chlamydomonas schloesseri]|uniref:Uncharacterized protein n=1 Tax=Chlamydomonas schloesseri TaxID=2026947 RepID=A0A836BBN8_9CHLO|nr:hypothetical protein HYH02_001709 [Chlamydomonas schloesseri]|eukprot:KAG2453488.1 hypothetical protein HYH02_001709 [Chlamydomonas schloesseri]